MSRSRVLSGPVAKSDGPKNKRLSSEDSKKLLDEALGFLGKAMTAVKEPGEEVLPIETVEKVTQYIRLAQTRMDTARKQSHVSETDSRAYFKQLTSVRREMRRMRHLNFQKKESQPRYS